jgi:hypothetical protein
MTSRVIIPFNNNPSSVSVKTASYTIPAGKYAQVYIECDSGGIFTIDGANAVVTSAFVNVDAAATNATMSYTVPVGFKFRLASAGSSTNNAVVINGATYADFGITAGSSAAITGVTIGPGGTVSISNTTYQAQQQLTGIQEPSNATHRQATFWVKSGTVISGSGNWKAVVQEFYSIS